MKRSVALPTPIHEDAVKHLLRSDGQEDLCFALWYPSTGASRQTALLQKLILPIEGDRRVHGNASFLPEYFERIVGIARREEAGIAFLHSHPSAGWQGMSPDDVDAEMGHAASVLASTGLPLVGLTIGSDQSWSARFWVRSGSKRYKREWCESVRVVGESLRVTYNESLLPRPSIGKELDRTVSAWGETAQANLSRLKIGVVGAGSVGSIVAETLARMGIAHIRLFDFDIVECVNLDRLLHATRDDAHYGRLKVDVMARQLKESATAKPFNIDPLPLSIVEPKGLKEALDCDVLFSCVDRPWPRFVLNFIAYAHLIPVVDGGIRVTPQPRDRGLRRGTWKAHVAAPTRRCLECLGQYDLADVTLERTGMLDDPTYIEGLSSDHLLRSHQNVFSFSLRVASLEIFQFLRMSIPHPGHTDIGAETEDFVSGKLHTDLQPCNPNCPFCDMVAKGEKTGFDHFTGQHPVAEAARADQAKRKTADDRIWQKRLLVWLYQSMANIKRMQKYIRARYFSNSITTP